MSGGMVLVDVSGKAEVVLTTKGDLATWDTARVRKGVSATNYTGLQADSAIADGLTYGATARSTLSGTGSLLYSSGANTLSQLSAGIGEYTLKMNAGGTAPEWVNVSAGGATTSEVNATITSNFTTTSTSFTDLTGLGVTVLNSAGGAVLAVATLSVKRSTTGGLAFALENDGVRITQSWIGIEILSADAFDAVSLATSLESDGSVIQCLGYTGGGTLTVGGSTTSSASSINCIGVA